MSDRQDPAVSQLERLKLSIYLLPIIGCIPAIWTLTFAEKPSTQQLQASRLSVALGSFWLLAYLSLSTGTMISDSSQILSLRLLYLNGLVTSGYFLICLGFLWRLKQGKTPRL